MNNKATLFTKTEFLWVDFNNKFTKVKGNETGFT